jgi:hypothetical protein
MPSLITNLPEKFRRYECSDCQVCPFNPRTDHRPFLFLILWYLLGTLLAPVRLLLLAICVMVASVFEALAYAFAFIPSLRKVIRFIGVSLPCRAVLFLFGFVSVSAVNVNVPAQQKFKLSPRAFASVKAGSLVISNLVSIAEIFYFEYSFSPVFAVPSASGQAVIPCSFYQMMKYVLFDSVPSTGEISLSKLQELAARNLKPALLFAEGFSTNGQALLPFADVVQENSKCICAVVSVEGWKWKPVFTVEGGWAYLFSLLFQPKLSLVIKCIPEECCSFLGQCPDASQRSHMVNICFITINLNSYFARLQIRDSMAKVGSLSVIKQYSSAQGDNKQVFILRESSCRVFSIERRFIVNRLAHDALLQPWVFTSSNILRSNFKNEWIDHFNKKKKK